MNTHSSRLKALRTLMKQRGLAAVIVPRQDEFQGEYVAPYAERLQWLTGFKGSWGVAIVGLRKAAIFVDGRYTLQVRQQTDTALFEPRHLMEDPPVNWIAANLKKGEKIGFDPWVTPVAEARKLRAAAEAVHARLVPLPRNPIELTWPDQPARPAKPISSMASNMPVLRQRKSSAPLLQRCRSRVQMPCCSPTPPRCAGP